MSRMIFKNFVSSCVTPMLKLLGWNVFCKHHAVATCSAGVPLSKKFQLLLHCWLVTCDLQVVACWNCSSHCSVIQHILLTFYHDSCKEGIASSCLQPTYNLQLLVDCSQYYPFYPKLSVQSSSDLSNRHWSDHQCFICLIFAY
jgi:hypothetical protein